MSELRIFPRRDSPPEEWPWVLRDGAVAGSGKGIENLPRAARRHLVLASDLVNTVPADLPDLAPRKLAPLLGSAAEAHALDDAENLHVAWLGRDGGGGAWLAIIDRTWLQRTLAILRTQGVEVDAALPESLLLPTQADTWSVLWQQDGALARLGSSRGLALDQEQPPAGLRLALAEAAPARIRVYRGNALHPADLSIWGADLGVAVEDAGPWSWREAVWPDQLNLLQGAFQPRHHHLDWPGLGRRLAWGLALLAGIQFLGTTLDWLLLVRERQMVQAEMQDLAARALPAHAAIVDPAWQVSERLRAVQAARGEGDGGVPGLLGRVGQAWPEGVAPAQVVDYREQGLTLTLATPPGDWLAGFQTRLAAVGLHLVRNENTLTIRAAREESHGR